MKKIKKGKSLKKIKELTKVPRLTYNYEAQPIDKMYLDSAEETANLVRHFFDKGSIRSQEEFLLMMLDNNNQCIGVISLFKGARSKSLADHHLILSLLYTYMCDYFVIAHNHPTKNYLPSQEDIDLTVSLKYKASYFDIDLKDHLIITEKGYYSFEESFRLW